MSNPPPDRPPRRRPDPAGRPGRPTGRRGSGRRDGGGAAPSGPGAARPPRGERPAAGRPSGRRRGAPAARPGAPGEGWDDGRGGGGGAGARRPRRRAVDADGGGADSGGGLLGRLPRWAIPAAVAAILLVAVLAVVLRRDGGSADAGPCLTELSAVLPSSATRIFGTDLVQARSAGYADAATLEELGDSQAETGAIPDALSQRLRYGKLVTPEEFTARTGVEPDQIECSLSDGQRAAMSGTFDVAEVSGSAVADEGDLAAAPDRLGYATGDADARRLLDPRPGGGLGSNDDVTQVLASLREDGAYSVLVEVGDPDADDEDPRAAGLGVAASGDDRGLVVAYAFADDDAAQAGRADVVDQVNAAVEGISSITADDLQVEGSLVRATIPTRKAPDLMGLVTTDDRLLPARG